MRLLILAALLGASRASWTVPAVTTIQGRCAFWKDSGTLSTRGDEYATFVVDCTSVRPTDVVVYANGLEVMSTDQKVAALLPTIRIRDQSGAVFATAKVEFSSSFLPPFFMTYTLTAPNGTLLARCARVAVWSTVLTFTDAGGETVAVASATGMDNVRAKLCLGATWTVDAARADADTRKAVVALATVSAIQDSHRDSKGRVSGSPCHTVFWVLAIGGPCVVLALVYAGVVWYRRRVLK